MLISKSYVILKDEVLLLALCINRINNAPCIVDIMELLSSLWFLLWIYGCGSQYEKHYE